MKANQVALGMVNEALMKIDHKKLNHFTTILRDRILKGDRVLVKLRNGTVVQCFYEVPNKDHEYGGFMNYNGGCRYYCWFNSGQSSAHDDYDIIGVL